MRLGINIPCLASRTRVLETAGRTRGRNLVSDADTGLTFKVYQWHGGKARDNTPLATLPDADTAHPSTDPALCSHDAGLQHPAPQARPARLPAAGPCSDAEPHDRPNTAAPHSLSVACPPALRTAAAQARASDCKGAPPSLSRGGGNTRAQPTATRPGPPRLAAAPNTPHTHAAAIHTARPPTAGQRRWRGANCGLERPRAGDPGAALTHQARPPPGPWGEDYALPLALALAALLALWPAASAFLRGTAVRLSRHVSSCTWRASLGAVAALHRSTALLAACAHIGGLPPAGTMAMLLACAACVTIQAAKLLALPWLQRRCHKLTLHTGYALAVCTPHMGNTPTAPPLALWLCGVLTGAQPARELYGVALQLTKCGVLCSNIALAAFSLQQLALGTPTLRGALYPTHRIQLRTTILKIRTRQHPLARTQLAACAAAVTTRLLCCDCPPNAMLVLVGLAAWSLWVTRHGKTRPWRCSGYGHTRPKHMQLHRKMNNNGGSPLHVCTRHATPPLHAHCAVHAAWAWAVRRATRTAPAAHTHCPPPAGPKAPNAPHSPSNPSDGRAPPVGGGTQKATTGLQPGYTACPETNNRFPMRGTCGQRE
jgi:hypothetical protein